MIDERLLWLLRKAGEEWGPVGVAMAAAHLAGEGAVLQRLVAGNMRAQWEPMENDES